MLGYIKPLLITTIIAVIIILLTHRLARKLSAVNKRVERVEENIRQNRSESHLAKAVATRNSALVKSQDERIECLEAQMAQVHHWLGDVLQISNLIRCETGENNIDTIDVVRILRERVEWQKEIESRQLDDSNYYQGE
jgi:hypothetical protein